MNRYVVGVIGVAIGIAVGAGAAEPAKKPQLGRVTVTCPAKFPLLPVSDAGNGWKLNVGAQYFARVEYVAKDNEVWCWYSNQNAPNSPATDFLSKKLASGAKGCGVASDGRSVECTGTDTPPTTPTPTASTAPTDACAARTCGSCVGEAGCWWNTSRKTCLSGNEECKACAPDGDNQVRCKDCVNELAYCPR